MVEFNGLLDKYQMEMENVNDFVRDGDQKARKIENKIYELCGVKFKSINIYPEDPIKMGFAIPSNPDERDKKFNELISLPMFPEDMKKLLLEMDTSNPNLFTRKGQLEFADRTYNYERKLAILYEEYKIALQFQRKAEVNKKDKHKPDYKDVIKSKVIFGICYNAFKLWALKCGVKIEEISQVECVDRRYSP